MDRLRWNNIARAGAVLALVALVVAWPHLKGAPPALPSAAATPVSIEDPAVKAAAQEPASEPAPARPRPKPHHRRKPHRVRHHAHPRARPAPRPALVTTTAPPRPSPAASPAPAPAPSTSDMAAHEFAVP